MAARPTRAPPASSRPLFGRAEVWKEIDLLLDETAEGTGRGIFLTGVGGVGKTEFLKEAAARAERRGLRVAIANAPPDELPAPFSLVRDLVASFAQEREPPPAEEPLPATNLPVLFVPIVDGPTGPSPGTDAAPAADDELERILAPLGRTSVEGLGARRERLYARLVDHFLGLARRHPLLLAIDDLPFADRSSLEFLARLAPELPNTPIAIVATAGPEAERPEPNRAIVDRLAGSPAVRPVALRALSVPELTEFVAWLQQGIAPGPADVERWYAQTDGNPLFVEQLVRASLAGGPHDPPAADAGPGLVGVLLTRIRALDDTERRVLTYAAVLGRATDFGRLAAVAGVDEERLSEALDRLVLAGLLREKGGEVYEFVSEAARASVYAELTETRRRILHHRVGAALEARGGTSNFELARQFYLGRDYAKTVEYNLRAAETAARSFAFDAAISHLARALEAERRRDDPDPRREVRLLTEYGRLLHETGDLLRSEELLGEAVELARAAPHQELELGRALLALAWTRVDRGTFETAQGLAEEAIALLERGGTARDLFSGHRVLGHVFWRLGDIARAEAEQRTALDIAEREGTPIERGHALVDVANTLIPQGGRRWETAMEMYGRAAELFGAADDPSARARVMMNRAVLEYTQGRLAEALPDLEAALAAAERSRSPLWIGYCLLNLAQWKAEAGDAPAGKAALDRAIEVLRPLDDRVANQQVAMDRGMIAEATGAYDDAEAHFRDALAQAREAHLAAESSEMLFRLAQLALHRGDRVAARRWFDEATASGLKENHPDFAPRIAALQAALRSGR